MTEKKSVNEETTEIFFAVELTTLGAIHIYPEFVEWKEGNHLATLPEIADLSARVATELNRHLTVTQVTDNVAELLEQVFPSPEVPFSEKLVEALKSRGITATKNEEETYFPFPLKPGGNGEVQPPDHKEKDE